MGAAESAEGHPSPSTVNQNNSEDGQHEEAQESWLSYYMKPFFAPGPSVRIEGDKTIRAGRTFCLVVTGYDPIVLPRITPSFGQGMNVQETEMRQCPYNPQEYVHYEIRYHVRAVTTGTFNIPVQNVPGLLYTTPVTGSPVKVVVEPGPLLAENCDCKPYSGEVPAVGHICEKASSVRYDFIPRDEFGNDVPCTDEMARHLSIQSSSDLLIMDTEPEPGKIKLYFRPLEEGQVEVMLSYDNTHIFASPITILTVPREIARAIRNGEVDEGGFKCELVSYCRDEVGAVEQKCDGTKVRVYVSPSRFTVKRSRIFRIFDTVIMCWPLCRSLSLNIVEIPEYRRYTIDKQRVYLDISEVGTGRMRLLVNKMSALSVTASTKNTLNKRYIGGALEKRLGVLNSKLRDIRGYNPDTLEFRVKRDEVISAAWRTFSRMKEPRQFLSSTHVRFVGEEGIDSGGLSKEFMSILQRDLFDPKSGLWAPPSRAIKLQPKTNAPPPAATAAADSVSENEAEAGVNDDFFAPLVPCADPSHELSNSTGVAIDDLYRLCGIVVARTLAHSVLNDGHSLLPFRIATSVFKHVLSLRVGYKDLAVDDPSCYSSTVRQILDNSVEGLDLVFAEDLFTLDNKFVRSVCIDPLSSGYYALENAGKSPRSRPQVAEPRDVDDSNKVLFVDELARYRLRGAMLPHLDAFREGFLKVIDDENAALLTPEEIVMETCASTTIDVEDMKKHAKLTNADAGTAREKSVKWLWEALSAFCESERRMFLLFVTGSMCPPQGGFANLKPQLHIVCLKLSSHNDLPCAHTCFNELDLPPYTSYSELFSKLLMAINEGSGYNGIA